MGTLLNRLVDSFKGVGRMGRSLVAVLAVSNPAELRQQLRYLKAENEALRAQLKGPVRVTAAQRATRRRWASPATTTPTEDWAAVQAREFVQAAEVQGAPPCKVLVRDNDTKFGPLFNRVVEARGITTNRLPYCSPNLNAHVERFIQSARVECLDRFIVLGTRHLDRLVGEYVKHYNGERPHSGLGHRIPGGPAPPVVGPRAGPVVCRTRLGGALRWYRRAG